MDVFLSRISHIALTVSAQWLPSEIPAESQESQCLNLSKFIVDLIATRLHELNSVRLRCSPRSSRVASAPNIPCLASTLFITQSLLAGPKKKEYLTGLGCSKSRSLYSRRELGKAWMLSSSCWSRKLALIAFRSEPLVKVSKHSYTVSLDPDTSSLYSPTIFIQFVFKAPARGFHTVAPLNSDSRLENGVHLTWCEGNEIPSTRYTCGYPRWKTPYGQIFAYGFTVILR